MRSVLLALVFVCLIAKESISQSSIMYQYMNIADHITMGFGSYGRVGVSGMSNVDGVEGRRLNLNNMGSVGGRMEEQDYLELGMGFIMKPAILTKDSTTFAVNMRASLYNINGAYFFNTTSRSDGGLTFTLPELYVEGKNVFTKDLNLWVGARFYRGGDVHMADYFYFNDHSGQGFGAEYKGSRLSFIYVSSNDTTQTVPPYFYLNIKSGTQSLALRQRAVINAEQDLWLGKNTLLTFLGEAHIMSDPTDVSDTSNILLSYPGDYGLVLGAKLQQENLFNKPGSFNQIAVRYGNRIANGGDGGSTRTYLTYGAPNLTTNTFANAYSWHIVDHFLLNLTEGFSLNGYAIFNRSVGAADTKDLAPTYFGKEVYNSKMDFSIGAKGVNYLSDFFHWQTELHYSMRQDGTQPWYNVTKLSLVPTIALRGEKSVWSRPHLRFVYSVARFNDYAVENSYSPYLELAGSSQWGHYFGVKAEWWTW